MLKTPGFDYREKKVFGYIYKKKISKHQKFHSNYCACVFATLYGQIIYFDEIFRIKNMLGPLKVLNNLYASMFN